MPDPKGLKVLHPFKGNQKQPGCQLDRHHAKFSVHSSPLCWGINIFYYAGPHAEFQESASLTATICLPFKQKFSRVCIGCLPENIKRKKVYMLWGNTFSNVSVIQPFPQDYSVTLS